MQVYGNTDNTKQNKVKCKDIMTENKDVRTDNFFFYFFFEGANMIRYMII